MALSAFDDKTIRPKSASLEKMLGATSPLWSRLCDELHAVHGPLSEEWAFSGQAYGWTMRLKQKKRVIVYMTPCRGHFLASFALGEKACASAHAAGLSPEALALIDQAPKYAEGRGARIPVRRGRDVEIIKALAVIKLAH